MNCIMEQIILSVIIAVHNTEEYVEQSLKSLDQALHGYKLSSTVEAIIVDDASSDNSVSIINNYKPDNFKKRFFSVNYNNVGKVKRFAFKQCQGNYITILDSDDAFRNNALTLITKTLVSNKYDMVITPISEVYNNFQVDAITHLTQQEKISQDNATKLFLSHKKIEGHIAGKFIKRSLLTDDFFPETLCYEDIITIGHAISKSTDILFCNSHLYLYRKRTGSISNDKGGEKIAMLFDALEKIENIFSPQLKYANIVNALWVKCISDLVARGKGRLPIPENAKRKLSTINTLSFVLDPKVRLSRKRMLLKLKVMNVT